MLYSILLSQVIASNAQVDANRKKPWYDNTVSNNIGTQQKKHAPRSTSVQPKHKSLQEDSQQFFKSSDTNPFRDSFQSKKLIANEPVSQNFLEQNNPATNLFSFGENDYSEMSNFFFLILGGLGEIDPRSNDSFDLVQWKPAVPNVNQLNNKELSLFRSYKFKTIKSKEGTPFVIKNAMGGNIGENDVLDSKYSLFFDKTSSESNLKIFISHIIEDSKEEKRQYYETKVANKNLILEKGDGIFFSATTKETQIQWASTGWLFFKANKNISGIAELTQNFFDFCEGGRDIYLCNEEQRSVAQHFTSVQELMDKGPLFLSHENWLPSSILTAMNMIFGNSVLKEYKSILDFSKDNKRGSVLKNGIIPFLYKLKTLKQELRNNVFPFLTEEQKNNSHSIEKTSNFSSNLYLNLKENINNLENSNDLLEQRALIFKNQLDEKNIETEKYKKELVALKKEISLSKDEIEFFDLKEEQMSSTSALMNYFIEIKGQAESSFDSYAYKGQAYSEECLSFLKANPTIDFPPLILSAYQVNEENFFLPKRLSAALKKRLIDQNNDFIEILIRILNKNINVVKFQSCDNKVQNGKKTSESVELVLSHKGIENVLVKSHPGLKVVSNEVSYKIQPFSMALESLQTIQESLEKALEREFLKKIKNPEQKILNNFETRQEKDSKATFSAVLSKVLAQKAISKAVFVYLDSTRLKNQEIFLPKKNFINASDVVQDIKIKDIFLLPEESNALESLCSFFHLASNKQIYAFQIKNEKELPDLKQFLLSRNKNLESCYAYENFGKSITNLSLFLKYYCSFEHVRVEKIENNKIKTLQTYDLDPFEASSILSRGYVESSYDLRYRFFELFGRIHSTLLNERKQVSEARAHHPSLSLKNQAHDKKTIDEKEPLIDTKGIFLIGGNDPKLSEENLAEKFNAMKIREGKFNYSYDDASYILGTIFSGFRYLQLKSSDLVENKGIYKVSFMSSY
jgi:hypothetical protein